MSRSLFVLLVCALLAGSTLGQGLAGVTDGARPNAVTGERPGQFESVGPPFTVATQDGFAQSTFQIEVFANGSARWTFRFVRPLANDSEREQFRTFADQFESTETDFYRTYRERSIALTNAASNTTGREMTARNFSRNARIVPPGNRGIVEVSFVWTDLGVVEGDSVRVADVFEGGFYIADDQWLVFETGPGLAFDPARTEPSPDEFSADSIAASETITWIGQQQFTDKHPRVVLAPASQVATDGGGDTDTATRQGTAGTNASGGAGGDGGSLPILLIGLVVLGIGLGAGAAWRTGLLGSSPGTGSGGTSAEHASTESASTESASAGAASAGAADTARETEPSTESTEPAVPDEELLTDEDRVIQMLEESGGRMKQANIVDETGWSKSKVSMLLSDMEEEGDISKLRVGRENIVSLKGHEPDAAGSPFDDED
jgi:uncharacterized membrane protein